MNRLAWFWRWITHRHDWEVLTYQHHWPTRALERRCRKCKRWEIYDHNAGEYYRGGGRVR